MCHLRFYRKWVMARPSPVEALRPWPWVHHTYGNLTRTSAKTCGATRARPMYVRRTRSIMNSGYTNSFHRHQHHLVGDTEYDSMIRSNQHWIPRNPYCWWCKCHFYPFVNYSLYSSDCGPWKEIAHPKGRAWWCPGPKCQPPSSAASNCSATTFPRYQYLKQESGKNMYIFTYTCIHTYIYKHA